MTLGAVDYVASYFKYKTPTPIQGIPTYKALKRLKAELRANASSVETDLGGGNHGYLGLVLSDAEYAQVSPIPFVAPAYPAPLTIPANATQVTAFERRAAHEEAKRVYYECQNIEKALQRHIQDAIEDKYLEHLIDEDTQLIHEDIPDILDYLMENYGRVRSEEVTEQYETIRKMSFHPADPMITLFGPIEKLEKLAVAANLTYSQNQLIDLALTVIRNTRDYEQALLNWEKKPLNQKTWDELKTHFKTAQQELKKIRGPTMQQAGYHHANMLAQSLKEDLDQKNEELLTMMQSVIEQSTTQPDPASEISAPSAHLASTPTNDTVQLQILQLIQQIQQDMKACVAATNNNTKEIKKTNRKTRDSGGLFRKDISKYCWTHGACGHTGKECRAKAPGHRDDATLENRNGGSNARCPA